MSRFDEWKPPEIVEGQDTPWGWRVRHVDRLALGKRVDIGYGCYIMAGAGIMIEDDVQIGSHCSIYSVNTIDDTHGPVVIRKGAKIGSHTTIFPGVTIGENATIGAHSLVKKDIPEGETWFGVPAKKWDRWGKYVSGKEYCSSWGEWADRA